MQDFTKMNTPAATVGFDAGLRSFMLKVYNYMTVALILSGAVAYFAASSAAFQQFLFSNHFLVYVIMFAPLIFIFIFSARLNMMSLASAQLTYWSFSVVMGLSLWFIFAVYTKQSIVESFFITSATFAGMSLFGYTTKRDLTGMGHFMIMGLFGIILAMLVNIFLQSSAHNFAVSIIGVVVFTGLTAYDTQKLKQYYYAGSGNAAATGKYAIYGALSLYLDFINMFLMILRLTGGRR